MIMLTGHSQRFVDLLSRNVRLLYVESKAPKIFGSRYHLAEVGIERPEDSPLAMRGKDVDGVDPENRSVSPVTPFRNGEKAADHFPLMFCNPVLPLGRIVENSTYSLAHGCGIELEIFCLKGHLDLEVGDNIDVEEKAWTNKNLAHVRTPRTRLENSRRASFTFMPLSM